MKILGALSTAILATGILLGAACSTTGHERTAGQYASDAEITTKVKSQMLTEKDVKSFDISVETFNGVVQLSGFVNSQMQIDKAVQVATAVTGVKRVQNDLIHKPE
jgi:osmotically-inducible protein OsmY